MPSTRATSTLIDSPNCLRSPPTIGLFTILSPSDTSTSWENDWRPEPLSALIAWNSLELRAKRICAIAWLAPLLTRFLFDFLVCLPKSENVTASMIDDLPEPLCPQNFFNLPPCHNISRTDLSSFSAASGNTSPIVNLASSSDPNASVDSLYSSLSMSAGLESYTVVARYSSNGCQM